MALEQLGTDVVLNAGRVLDSDNDLQKAIGYRLGSLITTDGIRVNQPHNAWLIWGIAAYVSEDAKPARFTFSAVGLAADMFDGTEVRTIAPTKLPRDTDAKAVDAYYGAAHFAVDCPADAYGEEKLFAFAALVLRKAQARDGASRQVFGKPFATVDRACIS